MFKLSVRTFILAALTLSATHQAQSLPLASVAGVIAYNGASIGVGAGVQTWLRRFTEKYGAQLAEYGPKAKKISPVLMFGLSLAIPFGVSRLMGLLPVPKGAASWITNYIRMTQLAALIADWRCDYLTAQATPVNPTV